MVAVVSHDAGPAWPVVPGAYVVGDPAAAVAICTLTDDALFPELASAPGVAIAGRLNTANLGIEDLVVNVTADPNIRFLVLCGKESPLFRPAQTLRALVEHGVDAEGRVIGGEGHNPVLRNVPRGRIEQFRQQVEISDHEGQTDVPTLRSVAAGLSERTPGPFPSDRVVSEATTATFAPIAPGGRREPLWYDPKGFFVIDLDRSAGEIVVRHFERDYRPAHVMRAHSAEAIVLGLLREELVSQLSHAGYLGAELAKAETALRLDLRYEQDRPLRPRTLRDAATADD